METAVLQQRKVAELKKIKQKENYMPWAFREVLTVEDLRSQRCQQQLYHICLRWAFPQISERCRSLTHAVSVSPKQHNKNSP